MHRRRPRVLSLVPSATEIVCALGLANYLVGRSHECDYPPSIRALPPCTAPRIDPAAAGGKIDRDVTAMLRETQPLYTLDAKLVESLNPDVILTQGQCSVCAVDPKQVKAALASISHRPKLIALTTSSFADLWHDIREVGAALDAFPQTERLIEQLQTRTEEITAATGNLRPIPTVACLEWLDPLISSGNWIPELVAMAGGKDIFGQPGRVSTRLDWETLVAHDPDVLVVMACGFDIPRSCRELDAVMSNSRWSGLRAVRAGKVFVTDGNQYFNRPGPRLIESLEVLAEILHPRTFHFGHEGDGWRRLT